MGAREQAVGVLAEHGPEHTEHGPPFCRPCSEAVGDWVRWTPEHVAAALADAGLLPEGESGADYVWRVTNVKTEGITLSFGDEMSAAPFSDDDKVHALGKALIKVGTQLMTSTTHGEDEDEDWGPVRRACRATHGQRRPDAAEPNVPRHRLDPGR